MIQFGAMLKALNTFKYIPGSDAYFLVIQAQTLMAKGTLKVPDGGVLAYPIAFISLFGPTIEDATRMILIANICFLQYSILFVLFYFLRGWKAVLAAAVTLSSVALLYNGIEFPKLTMAMSLMPWCFLIAHSGRTNLAIILALAACLLHFAMIAPLVVLFAFLIPEHVQAINFSKLLNIKYFRQIALACLIFIAISGATPEEMSIFFWGTSDVGKNKGNKRKNHRGQALAN